MVAQGDLEAAMENKDNPRPYLQTWRSRHVRERKRPGDRLRGKDGNFQMRLHTWSGFCSKNDSGGWIVFEELERVKYARVADEDSDQQGWELGRLVLWTEKSFGTSLVER